MVTLNIDIPARPWLAEQAMVRREPDWNKIYELCETFELKSIMKELDGLRTPADDLFSIPATSPTVEGNVDIQSENPEKFAPDLFA